MSEFNALTIAQIIAALRAENQSLHAERDEANRVCEQWRQWSARDQARIAELESALRLARVVLPAANSLPQTQTLVGDVVAAVDKALRASSPTPTAQEER